MHKTVTFLGVLMISASAFQMQAEKAPLPATQENLVDYKLSCGKIIMGLGPDAFQFPWEYEEYALNLNYINCGDLVMPETGTRPPTTEPDPGVLGVKPGEKKK